MREHLPRPRPSTCSRQENNRGNHHARARPSRLGGTLALVGDVRRLAYDRSLDDADRALRIRDRFGVYDGLIDDE